MDSRQNHSGMTTSFSRQSGWLLLQPCTCLGSQLPGVSEDLFDPFLVQPGAQQYVLREFIGDQVAGFMGVGIDHECGSCCDCDPGHVSVRETVTLSRGYLQANSVFRGKFGLVPRNEPWMGKDIDTRFDGCPVRPRMDGLHERLSVRNDDSCPERTRPVGEFGKGLRGYMRQFDAGERRYLPAPAQFPACGGDARNGEIDVRRIGMVGYGYHVVAFHDRAADQFRRYEYPVAEQ